MIPFYMMNPFHSFLLTCIDSADHFDSIEKDIIQCIEENNLLDDFDRDLLPYKLDPLEAKHQYIGDSSMTRRLNAFRSQLMIHFLHYYHLNVSLEKQLKEGFPTKMNPPEYREVNETIGMELCSFDKINAFHRKEEMLYEKLSVNLEYTSISNDNFTTKYNHIDDVKHIPSKLKSIMDDIIEYLEYLCFQFDFLDSGRFVLYMNEVITPLDRKSVV